MRRSILAIGLFSWSCFALSNLLFDADTIALRGGVTLTATLEHPGDTVTFLLALDVNANGRYEEGVDLILFSSEKERMVLIDGMVPDNAADGILSLSFSPGEGGPFEVPGTQLWILDDGNGPDTAVIVVRDADPTDTYIAGTVRGPDDNPVSFIMVYAEVCTSMSGGNCPRFSAITSDKGTYVLYFPTELRGKTARIMVMDGFNVLQGAVTPHGQEVTIQDSLTGVDFQFVEATQFVKVNAKDQTGNAVAGVSLLLMNENYTVEVDGITDSNGIAVIAVSQGSWRLEHESIGPTSEFLTGTKDILILADDDTVEVDYVLYRADDSISGTIHSQDVGLDIPSSLMVHARGFVASHNMWISNTAIIKSDGSYVIPVYSGAAGYDIQARIHEELRQNYAVTPPRYETSVVGKSELNFEVLRIGVTIFCNNDISLDGLKSVDITLIDRANDRVFRAEATMPNPDIQIGVPAGTYTAILRACYENGLCWTDSATDIVLSEGEITFFVNDEGISVPEMNAKARLNRPLVFGMNCINARAGEIALQFTTPVAGRATLELFETTGRLAVRLYDAHVTAGTYVVRSFTQAVANALTSGAYIVRLTIKGDKFYSTTRMIGMTR